MSSSSTGDLARVEKELLARWPESRLEPSLTRINALVDLLGSPHRAMPVVQVAGTNGKTTTARMIDELLRGFGLRVGRFTSPHLESIRERIVLDGEPVSAERFVETYDDIAPYVQMVDAGSDVPMSFFEVMVGMAYALFADAPVDVAVIEVGMGGTWDATNVVDARVAVVTPGRAGPRRVPRPGRRARSPARRPGSSRPTRSPSSPTSSRARWTRWCAGPSRWRPSSPARAPSSACWSAGSPSAGSRCGCRAWAASTRRSSCRCSAPTRRRTRSTALAAVEAFLGAGAATGPIEQETVRAAFAAVRSPGRLERVRTSPTVLVDAAHNPAGMAATVDAIKESFDFTRLIGVVGCVARQGRRRACSPRSRTSAPSSSSPRTARRGPCRPTSSGALAVDVFGADRVSVLAAAGRGDGGGDRAGRGRPGRRPRRLRRAGHRQRDHGGGGPHAAGRTAGS